MKARTPVIPIFAIALAAACSADVSRQNIDGTSVDIVASSAPQWGENKQWVVDPKPIADIGAASGPEEYMLHQVKGVMRLGDGRILVAEFGVNLRYYDSTGKHDTTVVLRGDGPGELDVISKMLPWRGDSIALFGGALLSRGGGSVPVVILGGDGAFGRQLNLRWPTWTPRGQRGGLYRALTTLQGTTSDGQFVIRGDAAAQGNAAWTVAPFYRMSSDGAIADTIGFLDIAQVIEDSRSSSGIIVSRLRMDAPDAALHDNMMYFGSADRFEIAVYDLRANTGGQARPARIIRYEIPDKLADESIRARLRTIMLGQARRQADSLRTDDYFASLPANATLPAFQALRTDADGNLWVEHQRFNGLPVVRTAFIYSGGMPDDPAVENRWSVFDPNGKLLGDVITPTGLEISQIGHDWVLGLSADADGVQHVRMHRITR